MTEPVDKLYQDYPLLFTKKTSFYLPEGWVELVRGLCDVISNHLEQTYEPEVAAQMYVSQVKEKFGSLRFYMAHEDDFVSGAIAIAEYQSYHVCQRCGQRSTVRNLGGWISSLCDFHFDEENNKHEK